MLERGSNVGMYILLVKGRERHLLGWCRNWALHQENVDRTFEVNSMSWDTSAALRGEHLKFCIKLLTAAASYLLLQQHCTLQ